MVEIHQAINVVIKCCFKKKHIETNNITEENLLSKEEEEEEEDKTLRSRVCEAIRKKEKSMKNLGFLSRGYKITLYLTV